MLIILLDHVFDSLNIVMLDPSKGNKLHLFKIYGELSLQDGIESTQIPQTPLNFV